MSLKAAAVALPVFSFNGLMYHFTNSTFFYGMYIYEWVKLPGRFWNNIPVVLFLYWLFINMRKIPILKWSLYFCRLLSKMVYVFLKSSQILYTNIVIIIRIYNKFGVRIMHTSHINIHSSSVLHFFIPPQFFFFHLTPSSSSMNDVRWIEVAIRFVNQEYR